MCVCAVVSQAMHTQSGNETVQRVWLAKLMCAGVCVQVRLCRCVCVCACMQQDVCMCAGEALALYSSLTWPDIWPCDSTCTQIAEMACETSF